jgi:conjugal transfer pilus assembly protein TraW
MRINPLVCLAVAVSAICASQVAVAESLGAYGRTYQIKERDAIDAMKAAAKKKLANGGKEAMIKGAQDRYMASLNNIVTPKGIGATKMSTTRLVDLSETVKETITDGRGNVVVAAGTVINPLAIKPLTKKVYFIDAKDARQLQWVKKGIAANDKVILLGGSIFKASEVLQRHVYMDINGLYGRMKIRSLPSVVSQEGVKLKVEEVAL